MTDSIILNEDPIPDARGTVSGDLDLNTGMHPTVSEADDSPAQTVEPSVEVAEPDDDSVRSPATDPAPAYDWKVPPPGLAAEAFFTDTDLGGQEPGDPVPEDAHPIAVTAPAATDSVAPSTVITTDDADLARAAVGREIPVGGALGPMPAAQQSVEKLVGGEAILYKIEILDEPEHTLDEHSLACARDRFVEPQGAAPSRKFSEVLSEFLADDGRMIVVVGVPGTGRTTAATALLARIPSPAGRELSVEYLHLADSSRVPRHRIARKNNCGYLLQLPEDEAHVDSEDSYQVPDSLGGELMEAKALMVKRHSYLVIVTTPAQWERVSHGVPADAVWMGCR